MPEGHKTIPTIYKGIEFRSRTEARWAVFLDACGVCWKYRPQPEKTKFGYSFRPHFKLTTADAKYLYLEILYTIHPKDVKLLHEFADVHVARNGLLQATNPVLVVNSIPTRFDEGALTLWIEQTIRAAKQPSPIPYFNTLLINGRDSIVIPCLTPTGLALIQPGFEHFANARVDACSTNLAFLYAATYDFSAPSTKEPFRVNWCCSEYEFERRLSV